MGKFKYFYKNGPLLSENKYCDGLLNHKWKTLTCENGAGLSSYGHCWCSVCGARGIWQSEVSPSTGTITSITLSETNPNFFEEEENS